jgi:hypothetical protein
MNVEQSREDEIPVPVVCLKHGVVIRRLHGIESSRRAELKRQASCPFVRGCLERRRCGCQQQLSKTLTRWQCPAWSVHKPHRPMGVPGRMCGTCRSIRSITRRPCESEFSSLAVHEQQTQAIRYRCHCVCADVSFQPLCIPQQW